MTREALKDFHDLGTKEKTAKNMFVLGFLIGCTTAVLIILLTF
jgi:hypothetical protein